MSYCKQEVEAEMIEDETQPPGKTRHTDGFTPSQGRHFATAARNINGRVCLSSEGVIEFPHCCLGAASRCIGMAPAFHMG